MGRPKRTPTVTEASRHSIDVESLRIVVLRGDGESVSAPLGLDRVVVGDGDEADLLVHDRRVSGRHCSLRATAAGVVLQDERSKNGTWIGPVRVREVLLPLGARVKIGGSELWVERAGAPQRVSLSGPPRFGGAVGEADAMRRLFPLLRRAAREEQMTVLLLGETGTGKSILAEALHRESGRTGKFVVVDCGAPAQHLVESDLFGHTGGAFTGASGARKGKLAEADGGTLFLDEIGDFPLELQSRLLRAIDERQYCPVGSNTYVHFRAQVVSATHKNLLEMTRAGKFRGDLYYRLIGLQVTVPPLRDRREDIALLVEKILAGMSPPRDPSAIPPQILEVLTAYDWPGNVRQLEHVVRRLVLLPDAPLDLDPGQPASTAMQAFPDDLAALPLADARDRVLAPFHRWYIARVLREHDGNVSAAAARMGIVRQQLHRLIRKHGIRADEPEGD